MKRRALLGGLASLGLLAACAAGEGETAAEDEAVTLADPDPFNAPANRELLSDRQVADAFNAVFYDQNELVKGFEQWVHPDYIQHDPNSPTGRDATIAVLAAHMQANPEMTHDIKRVIYGDKEEDGTLVAVHYHFKRAPDEIGLAVVDIYRIRDGYLVEHWDVIQPVPAEPLNDNTMF